MMVVVKRSYIIAIGALSLFTVTLQAAEPDWQTCEAIKNDTKRLACYDDFALQLRTQQTPSQAEAPAQLLAQPQREVLDSNLQTAANSDEFSLSVNAFIKLIKSARLDEGGSIGILGWQRLDNSNYILWLKLRGRTALAFQFLEKGPARAQAVSVLESVVMQGKQVDPAMFIMNIAAMSP